MENKGKYSLGECHEYKAEIWCGGLKVGKVEWLSLADPYNNYAEQVGEFLVLCLNDALEEALKGEEICQEAE